jgi:predicted dehydrogenase
MAILQPQFKKIKVGLASFGMSGKVFHAPLLQAHIHFELYAICERSKNEAITIYPNVHIVKSFDELLLMAEVELIIVNTPDPTHFDHCKAALLAGKHVVVEKPFVFTVKEGEELISIADNNNLVLSIFQNRRWDGDFLTVQKIIAENKLGRIVEFRSNFERYRNYSVPGSWKESTNRFVGTVYNLGSHLADQAMLLFGMPDGVFARIYNQRDFAEVDDFFQLILIYKHVHVTLSAGYLMREPTHRFVVNGTLGSFVKNGIDPQEEMLKSGILPTNRDFGKDSPANFGILHTEINGEAVRNELETIQGNYLLYYDNIADCIRMGGILEVSAKENLQLIRILEAAFQSQLENRIVFFT